MSFSKTESPDSLSNKKILVVGQTPPPFHGQAIMVEKLLSGNYGDIQLIHIRMEFSSDLNEVGKFKLGKIVELFRIIGNIIWARLKRKIDVLFYPPASPNLIPVIRDILILISTRWMFRKTIYHIHASGLSDYYDKLSWLMRFLFAKAYFYPDAVIRLSEYSPEDGKLLKPKKEYIIPNGIDDEYFKYRKDNDKAKNNIANILFVGTMIESKGINVLIEACKFLLDQGMPIEVNMMGQFVSKQYETEVKQLISNYQMEENIKILGPLMGEKKWEKYAFADIFCFPSYYKAETLSVVVIEAMSFELPVVSTIWRGIPSIVEDGFNGYLVPIQNPKAIAEKLRLLIEDSSLRTRMGANGRKRYLEGFTVDLYHQRLREVFEATLSL